MDSNRNLLAVLGGDCFPVYCNGSRFSASQFIGMAVDYLLPSLLVWLYIICFPVYFYGSRWVDAILSCWHCNWWLIPFSAQDCKRPFIGPSRSTRPISESRMRVMFVQLTATSFCVSPMFDLLNIYLKHIHKYIRPSCEVTVRFVLIGQMFQRLLRFRKGLVLTKLRETPLTRVDIT
jgi:hypothetical protein